MVITAASSSVGLAAIQITKAAGALTIATTRGAAKKQFLLDAGADHVIVTNEENLADSVMAITAENLSPNGLLCGADTDQHSPA